MINEQFKQVPESIEQRLAIRNRVREHAAGLEQTVSMNRPLLESSAKQILGELGLPQKYTAWTMVLLGNEVWREQLETIPPSRRVLLLPHCMRQSPGCPGTYDQEGLICQSCGACPLCELKSHAESLGYHILIAEGTPIVMQWILNGKADAILGVGCLQSLERAFEKLQFAGIPAAAIPLWGATCKNSMTDISWIWEMIDIPYKPHKPSVQTVGTTLTDRENSGGTGMFGKRQPQTWLHLLRGATQLFEKPQLHKLLSPVLPSSVKTDITAERTDYIRTTGEIAFQFLLRGGKYYRPFITLAAYDAMTGSLGTQENGTEIVRKFPKPLQRIAVAMEIFHKASLVHDDVEDDDAFRYGHPAVHKEYDIPNAINVGDYLIGLGYHLIASQSREIGEDGGNVVADILQKLGEAHTKLCEGQGGELVWHLQNSQIHNSPILSAVETLKIYGLKTSPAFEAALYAGLRFGAMTAKFSPNWLRSLEQSVTSYSRFLGIAFQIKNDLEDWDWQNVGKKQVGTDVSGGRPTLLRALAFETLNEPDRNQFLHFVQELQTDKQTGQANTQESAMESIRLLYEKADVFNKASQLIGKYADRARTIVDQIEHKPLQPLLLHFINSLLGGF